MPEFKLADPLTLQERRAELRDWEQQRERDRLFCQRMLKAIERGYERVTPVSSAFGDCYG